jgi:hypothetical protein
MVVGRMTTKWQISKKENSHLGQHVYMLYEFICIMFRKTKTHRINKGTLLHLTACITHCILTLFCTAAGTAVFILISFCHII